MYAFKEKRNQSNNCVVKSVKKSSEDAAVIQRYSFFRDNNKIYTVTNDYRGVCGLDYPNHEFYVKNIQDVHTVGDDAMIEFQAGERKSFNHPLGEYVKVQPRWKPGMEFGRASALADIEEGFGQIPANKEDRRKLRAIDRISRHKETLKKYIIQHYYCYGQINQTIRQLYLEYRPVHILLSQFITGISGGDSTGMSEAVIGYMNREPSNRVDKTMLTERLQLICSICENTPVSYFDADSVMRPGIIRELKIIINYLNRLEEQPAKTDYRKAYLYRQKRRVTDDSIVLQRGCDLVADALGSRDNNDGSPIMWFGIKDRQEHHFSTSVFESGIDFVTMEGFADPAFQFYDDSWEFYMHGGLARRPLEAFQSYTEIRYSFFPQFQNGVEGAGAYSVKKAERYDVSRSYHDQMVRKYGASGQ